MATPPVESGKSTEKKASPAVLAVCALVLVFAVGLKIKSAIELRHPTFVQATLRGRAFTIEVADTVAKRDLGLGERDSLPADHGMYFPFDSQQRWVFWMKGMRFPIDIIWIQDGKIVGIEHSVPVPKSLPLETYSPLVPADAVLELNAGVAAEIGLMEGEDICIGSCPTAYEAPRPAAAPPVQEPEPQAKTYPDEDAASGTYANREIGIAFAYPEAWGEAVIEDTTSVVFDTGLRARVTFSASSSLTFDLFSSDWALGVGEGWSERLHVSGDSKDPLDTLAEAKARVHEDVIAFTKLGDGYLFSYQFTYAVPTLLAVYLAPGLPSGEPYHDVQMVVTVGRKGLDDAGYDAKEAAAAFDEPEAAAALKEAEEVFKTLRPYEG